MAKTLDKKRYFVINAIPYGMDVLICMNMTNKEALRVLNRLSESPPNPKDKDLLTYDFMGSDEASGIMVPLSKGYLVMLKQYKNSFRKNLCVAIHELTHVSHYILRSVRIPLLETSEEAYTYLIEDLMRQYLKNIY